MLLEFSKGEDGEKKSAAWELERAALLSPEPENLQIYSVGRPNRSVPSIQPRREQALSRGIWDAEADPRCAAHPAPCPGHSRINSSAL